MTKDQAAVALAERHRRIDPETIEIVRFLAPNEEAEGEPIKLVEVSTATLATGQIDAFLFAPAPTMPYYTALAVVSPEEWEQAKARDLSLPGDWSLDRSITLLSAVPSDE